MPDRDLDPGSLDAERLRPASQPIHRVAALHHVRIPVSDGLELSANLWLPEPLASAAEPQLFPAILEMTPYRKDDWRAPSDQSRRAAPAPPRVAPPRPDLPG